MRRILCGLLLSLIACAPLMAQEWYACEDVFSGALLSLAADSPIRGQRCRVVQRETVSAPGEMTLRIIETENYTHADGPHQAWAMEALHRSAATYARFYDTTPDQMPRTITVVFSGSFAYAKENREDDDRGLMGTAHGGRTPRKCVIALYEGSVSRETRRHGVLPVTSSEQDLKLTIAHEMFHCVQYAVARNQFARVGSNWWIEGSAEYMQYEVFPEYPMETDLVRDFDRQIASVPIFKMKYENAVFFAFLSSAQGLGSSRALVDLFRQMPVVNEDAAQRQALAAYPNISTLFQRFAEDYRDRAIFDPGGRPLPSFPLEPTPVPRVDDNEVYVIGIVPWTINPAPFLFSSGTNWNIKAMQVPVPTEIHAKTTSGGILWSPLPQDILACAGDQKVHVLATVTSADDTMHNSKLIIHELRGDARSCPCPLGPWTITEQDINKYFPIPSVAGKLTPGSRESTALADTPAPGSGGPKRNNTWDLRLDVGASTMPLLYFRNDGTVDYSAVLRFSGPRKHIRVPAVCSSESCWQACHRGVIDRRTCAPRRETETYVSIYERRWIKWRWRARGNQLIRETLGLSGEHVFYTDLGFGEKRISATPSNDRIVSPTSTHTFSCRGNELIIQSNVSASAGNLENLAAALVAGSAQQRAVGEAMRSTGRHTTDTATREAIGNASARNAYPFTGRFVRP